METGIFIVFILIPILLGIAIIFLTIRIAGKLKLPLWWSIPNAFSLFPACLWLGGVFMSPFLLDAPTPTFWMKVHFFVVLCYPIVLFLITLLSYFLYRWFKNWVSLIPPATVIIFFFFYIFKFFS